MELTKLFKLKSSADEWPEPETLSSTLLPVNPLVLNHVPAAFQDWVGDISERMQCPPDFVAVASIIITSSIIGTGCGIKPKQKDDWLVIPNLWGGIIGRPGMLKTPAVTEVMQILNQIEGETTKIYENESKEYQTELELYKAERDAIKNAMLGSYKKELKNIKYSQETLSLKEQLKSIKEPKKPIWNRFKTNDSTIEKLCEILANNPRGLLLYRDELIGLLASWEKEGRESDRAFFLEAWNGYGSLTTDRIGRGTVHIDNLCISIFGNMQPAKLSRYLHSAIHGIENDGLLQRFQLLIFPNDNREWRLIDKSADKRAKDRAERSLRTLAKMNFLEYGATKDNNDRFPYFNFDEDAQGLFYIWLTKLECEKLNADDHPILIEHLSKYRSLMPSLALIFHLIDVADGKSNKKISLDHALKAIAWCEYLEMHARRIYGLVSDLTKQAVIKLSKKIQAGLLNSPFSLRDIYRKEWALLSEKAVVKKACEELVDASWLRLAAPNSDAGRPRLPTYLINPKIKIQNTNTENFC